MAARKLRGTDPKAAKATRPRILLYGRPGVGKTWASIEFPSVYYIDTEGGANREHYTDKLKRAGGLYFGPEQGSLDFDTVIEEVITLGTIEHPYRTLVIDSFSKLYNARAAQAAEKGGDDFGRDKKEANKPTRKLIHWLNKIDMNVILICHEKDKWQNGSLIGQTFDGYDKLEYELDLALQIVKQKTKRWAKVTKSRLSQFPDEEVFPWSYADFAERYGRDVIEAKSTALSLATDEQVNQLTQLISVLRVEADTTGRWLEKAGVDSFAEMDRDTIAKCISHLESKLPKTGAA